MKTKYGVWYDGGGLETGWLSEEHNHGRQYRAEYYDKEEAEAAAQRERAHDPRTIFYVASVDTDHMTLFHTVANSRTRGGSHGPSES